MDDSLRRMDDEPNTEEPGVFLNASSTQDLSSTFSRSPHKPQHDAEGSHALSQDTLPSTSSLADTNKSNALEFESQIGDYFASMDKHTIVPKKTKLPHKPQHDAEGSHALSQDTLPSTSSLADTNKSNALEFESQIGDYFASMDKHTIVPKKTKRKKKNKKQPKNTKHTHNTRKTTKTTKFEGKLVRGGKNTWSPVSTGRRSLNEVLLEDKVGTSLKHLFNTLL